ncbi:MAG: CYTH domain-containing protein [Bacteroidia bacterium]|nr:CYTH domain-containing protein [Bacteroidia bacterium]MBT8310413.1 CYTH domain-containing protein [Bacteroidia bacterium]NND12124.1 CYTH domain-containing protein [Flavobacteriaceae bacterium]NNK28376.1 CYTH domain-containing protein [Flavobacteriaceae bacterium]NNL59866.1 CYTH domain-containing protein [Flavobacteriaceae bacterium]
MIEIERKFLVNSDNYKKDATRITEITQGFLNSDKERTVRVRLRGNKGMLTVKGISSQDGTTRFEWETELNEDEAKALLKLCENTIIKKSRYEIIIGNHLFEVDEFHDENKGLVIAEIELRKKDEKFDKPSWLGKEVTGDIKYYNSMLSRNPFQSWDKN